MPKIPDETVVKIAKMRGNNTSIAEIARVLHLDRETVRKYAPRYEVGGPPTGDINKVVDHTDVDGTIEVLTADRPMTVEALMTACGLDRARWIPRWFRGNVWEGFYKLADSHRKVKLCQSRLTCERVINEHLEEAILQFVRENVVPVPPPPHRPSKSHPGEGQMVVWGMWDAHIGAYAWDSETGANWDVDMACRRMRNSVDDILAELSLYDVDRIIMPVGNDFMHFDSCQLRTFHGEHPLDVDTRFARVYLAALRSLSYMVDAAASIADKVEILYVPGNHDVTSSFTLCAALSERYKDVNHVSVNLSANPRKYVRHGGVLVGFSHGDDCSPARLAQIFSTEARADWGTTTCREIHVGHKHQKRETHYDGVAPTSGITIKVNPSMCNADAWHHGKGFIGDPIRTVEAWRYDKVGCRGSHAAFARDDRRTDE